MDASVDHNSPFISHSPGRFTRVFVQTAAGEIEARLSEKGNWELRSHVAQKEALERASGPDAPMWVTRNGTPLSPNNIRRMLRTLVRRVNKKRAAEGKMQLPKVTPHTLRRTFACLCFWAGRELLWVMDQIGHDDSRMTVGVYAQTSQRKRVDRDLAWCLMRFPDEPEQRPGTLPA